MLTDANLGRPAHAPPAPHREPIVKHLPAHFCLWPSLRVGMGLKCDMGVGDKAFLSISVHLQACCCLTIHQEGEARAISHGTFAGPGIFSPKDPNRTQNALRGPWTGIRYRHYGACPCTSLLGKLPLPFRETQPQRHLPDPSNSLPTSARADYPPQSPGHLCSPLEPRHTAVFW